MLHVGDEVWGEGHGSPYQPLSLQSDTPQPASRFTETNTNAVLVMTFAFGDAPHLRKPNQGNAHERRLRDDVRVFGIRPIVSHRLPARRPPDLTSPLLTSSMDSKAHRSFRPRQLRRSLASNPAESSSPAPPIFNTKAPPMLSESQHH
ncbi:hypothetical protein GALMADRAFT_138897 [Galerina marginata CBS 339.88]|uniref:Uncharacterized protein n=1 Tax=Galerina marginata (strain CBS 339.88) TaxID=685588 RepID=A0A067TFV7_GALM3|nr:hypothetical protein GALMADRAFT_138897 [Galerina marginata CBS 339.88]